MLKLAPIHAEVLFVANPITKFVPLVSNYNIVNPCIDNFVLITIMKKNVVSSVRKALQYTVLKN